MVELQPVLSRKRTRGLWKGQSQRQTSNTANQRPVPASVSEGSFSEDDEADTDTISSGASKRRKCQLSTKAGSVSGVEVDHHDEFPIIRNRDLERRDVTSLMDTASHVRGRQTTVTEDAPGYEDWENLREIFTKAVEGYENDDSKEALYLLRRVVHECRRLFVHFQDPSVLFSSAASSRHSVSPESRTPPDELLFRDWELDYDSRPHDVLPKDYHYSNVSDDFIHHPGKSPELPTALHCLFGTALFLFGNLVAQDPGSVQQGEPDTPCSYWLAALDIFETGESILSQASGRECIGGQDWRMAIIWGRTLLCLADMAVTRASNAETPHTAVDSSSDEPTLAPDSAFATILSRRPPSIQRISLSGTSPHDLMVLAMDQFSRGIFHMPHPQHQLNASPCSASEQHFSRPKELFTIASEVLGIAERLEEGSQRQYWAAWADSVFSQMKMEADMDVWRGPITRARGRCWLIIGSSGAEPLEASLESGDGQILHSEPAQEARNALATAISFFERAKGSAMSWLDPESQELKPLMTEALLTLANLTTDENKREELYSRAQAESENSLVLGDDEKMDQSD